MSSADVTWCGMVTQVVTLYLFVPSLIDRLTWLGIFTVPSLWPDGKSRGDHTESEGWYSRLSERCKL